MPKRAQLRDATRDPYNHSQTPVECRCIVAPIHLTTATIPPRGFYSIYIKPRYNVYPAKVTTCNAKAQKVNQELGGVAYSHDEAADTDVGRQPLSYPRELPEHAKKTLEQGISAEAALQILVDGEIRRTRSYPSANRQPQGLPAERRYTYI
jgi:hypothetical protein